MQNNRNLSADLIRVGEFLYRGNDRLAEKFIQVCKSKYVISGKWSGLFDLILQWERDKRRAADAALTMGRLMLSA